MKKTALIASIFLATVAGVNAQLLTWDVQGVSGNVTTLTANTTAADLETTSGLNTLSRTTLVPAPAGNSFSSNTWNIGTFNEATNYFSFSLTPTAGNQATFTNLQYHINGSNTAPGTGRWGYSVGGGAFTLQDTFAITFTAPGSLATWDFEDFTTPSSVEFRFWASGATSISGITSANTGTVRISNIAGNDLVVNGSVAPIPEPTVVGLIIIGAAVALFARRRARA
jgi:hypothetical protein